MREAELMTAADAAAETGFVSNNRHALYDQIAMELPRIGAGKPGNIIFNSASRSLRASMISGWITEQSAGAKDMAVIRTWRAPLWVMAVSDGGHLDELVE